VVGTEAAAAGAVTKVVGRFAARKAHRGQGRLATAEPHALEYLRACLLTLQNLGTATVAARGRVRTRAPRSVPVVVVVAGRNGRTAC